MDTRHTTADLPVDLEGTRRRFEQWRQLRKAPTPIPAALWAAAVKLAGRYGISRTARVLRVGYYSLQERVERKTARSVASSPPRGAPTFVELTVPSGGGAGECLLEWEDAAGAKMRVHLQGVPAPDVVALSRSFWEGQR